MNIQEFFELSSGKWFAHRTSNDLPNNKSQEAKSEIVIEQLSKDSPEVMKLNHNLRIPNNSYLLAIKVNWNDTTKLNQKNIGSSILVLVPNSDNQNEGKLLRQLSSDGKISSGNYKLGIDESLTLDIEAGNIVSEERIWFASENLRMRVSTVKQADGLSTTAFTTEIRMGVAPKANS
jgi:CpeS-like protein